MRELVQWAQPIQQNHNEQRAARQAAAQAAARQENTLNCGAVVVSVLMVLAGTVVTVIALTGFGTPDRGRALRSSSARLRDDVIGNLGSARPRSACWSGLTATIYDGKTSALQDHIGAIAAADLQAADAVDAQAGQVAQSRQNLEIILAALVTSIAVAVVLQAHWKAAEAVASPAAPAYEAALIGFGLLVICAVIGGAVAALMVMDDAAQNSKTTLGNVTDTYKDVVHGVAATLQMKRATTF
ncbi:MAG: hypothetical protein K2Q25_13705 [Mycobacteriaceae bacterium]|nr:hypothetical protein [Mycobacteriaceae bacterium]